jgi:2-dehydropantoate 2-reductase
VRRNVPLGGDKHIVFRVGEPHGRITPRIVEIADMLSAADSSKATDNLWGERWSKLVANSMRNGLYASTGHVGGDIDLNEAARRTTIKLAGEAVVVGRAHGYVLEEIYHVEPDLFHAAGRGDKKAFGELEEILLEQARKSNRGGMHRPSMAQDIAKGRRTEIEYLNGFVCRKGAELGLATPANRMMVELVKKVERGEVKPDLKNVEPIGA